MIPRPVVTEREYNCISLNGDGLQLIYGDGLKEDVDLPSQTYLTKVRNRIIDICETGAKQCLVSVVKWGARE